MLAKLTTLLAIGAGLTTALPTTTSVNKALESALAARAAFYLPANTNTVRNSNSTNLPSPFISLANADNIPPMNIPPEYEPVLSYHANQMYENGHRERGDDLYCCMTNLDADGIGTGHDCKKMRIDMDHKPTPLMPRRCYAIEDAYDLGMRFAGPYLCRPWHPVAESGDLRCFPDPLI